MTCLLTLALPSGAQHDPAMHRQHMSAAAPTDGRERVHFPPAMREHTLTNMRDHLLALQEIQALLAKSEYDRAAEVAEGRLGMSSLALHGAHEISRFMPSGMQEAGTAMHRRASRFAIAARDAAVTADVRPALGVLSEVTAACVACHATYRLD